LRGVIVVIFSFYISSGERDTQNSARLPVATVPPALSFFIYFFSLHQIKFREEKREKILSGGIYTEKKVLTRNPRLMLVKKI
jgi:hypothetical protein